jgi:2,5-dihydroxypyridine 5,6-dioxygenase
VPAARVGIVQNGAVLVERIEGKWTYDRKDINGTELRAFAGNFLFSGANETAGRFTACHFDYPMRGCTVELDGVKVVDAGRLTQT